MRITMHEAVHCIVCVQPVGHVLRHLRNTLCQVLRILTVMLMQVWYEWAMTAPSVTTIHNPNGRSYHVGL